MAHRLTIHVSGPRESGKTSLLQQIEKLPGVVKLEQRSVGIWTCGVEAQPLPTEMLVISYDPTKET